MRANYEIAKEIGKVYESKKDNIAFWRAGWLMNITSDPLWLVYHKNQRDEPYWRFKDVITGDIPVEGLNPNEFLIKYEPPEFHSDWLIHFDQWNIDHILGDSTNQNRLVSVFDGVFSNKFNPHLVFRAIYGEIQLKRKEEVVLPQWYHGEYQYLMPLFLLSPDKVSLTAALTADLVMRRYQVRTLLLPQFAYAYARAIIKSRAQFADWMMLSEEDLNKTMIDEDVDSDV